MLAKNWIYKATILSNHNKYAKIALSKMTLLLAKLEFARLNVHNSVFIGEFDSLCQFLV